jgi:protein TonB
MMQVATLSELSGRAPSGEPNYPPVKPRWLGPATTVAVALAHAGLAYFLITTAIEKIAPLDSISMDLVPEGDMFESEQVEATDEAVPPEEMEQPDLAIPLPQVMTPDAPPIPLKKEVERKKRVVEHKQVAQAKEHRDAQERHRIGVAGGRGTGGLSQAGYKALLAAAIRRHVPSSSSLGEGSASCSFHVSSGGGMTGINCSGSSGAHASLLRSAIAATHAPPPPGGGFHAVQSVHFH